MMSPSALDLSWTKVKSYLIGQKQADSLQTLLSPVNIVTKKQIVRLGWKSTIFKQAQKVRVLTMYIPCKDVQ